MYVYIYAYIYISAGTKTRGHKGGHEHKLSSQVVRFFRMVCVWFQRLFPDEKSFFYRPAQLPLLAPVPVLGLAPAMAPRSARGPSRSMDPKNHGAFPWSNFHMIMKPTWWLTYPPEKYESQIGSSSQLLGKINNVPNHQPVTVIIPLQSDCWSQLSSGQN